MVMLDWYWRMLLESGLTEVWLAKGDLVQARLQAERFLEITLATAKRTWQALAWEANVRVAMTEGDIPRAHVNRCLRWTWQATNPPRRAHRAYFIQGIALA